MTEEIREPLNTEEEQEITGYTLEPADIVYADVDETLSIRGMAADAKVTGDYFRGLAVKKENGNVRLTIPV